METFYFDPDTLGSVTVSGPSFKEAWTMTTDELQAERADLEQRCDTVIGFGGSMARAYIWRPRIEAIDTELARRT